MSQWLFGPDSMMWKVNRESVLLLGGRAALLMQLAHPLVAAGVSDHSDFRSDSLGRLRRTLDVMLSITFGDMTTAEKMMRRVDAVHTRVKGTAPDGRAYSAQDPYLSKWVFTTLVYTSVGVYEACIAKLSTEESQQLYDESLVIARMFGIPGELMPATRRQLIAWMHQMIESDEIEVTPLARDLAGDILRPVRFVPRRVAEASAIVTRSLLPPKIRKGYALNAGLPDSMVLAVARRAARATLPLMPSRLRLLPAARAALRGATPA